MNDLISRKAALEEIKWLYPPKVANETEAEAINRLGWECAINCVEAYLRTVKPVDPVKHGKWKVCCYQNKKCSECGYIIGDDDAEEFHYCPNCGARMDGET